MMTLFAAKGTGSIAPQAVLALAGAEHQVNWIDYDAKEHHASGFLSINPRGQLPALQLEDGTVMTESCAIMLHLADCYPKAGLIGAVGTSDRALTYRWMVFMATNVYEDFLRMEYPAQYTADAAAERAVSAAGAASMDRSWSILNGTLNGRTCLVGNKVSIADIYLAMLLSWHPDLSGLGKRHTSLIPAARSTLKASAVQRVFDENGVNV